MAKQTVPDLKELFKQAAEIAQQVPESMQEAAFNRAIDLLTGTVQTASSPTGKPDTKKQKTEPKKEKGKGKQYDSPVDELLTLIDSTQHPGVTSTTKVLDRSLMVLQIALKDHNIDGLMPSDIARILTEKFRISTTLHSVGMALSKASNLVNRVPQGQGYAYKIMAPGEEYLTHLGEEHEKPPSKTSVAPKKRKRVVKDKGQENIKKPKKTTKGKATPKTTVGPKAAINTLVESGYFSKGRTGPEVQSHLKNKRGFNFGIHQIRLAMLRLVRNEVLERDSNAEKQYEYKKS